MDQKNLQNSIYRYLLARIHYGFYKTGEALPSIYRLSEMFGISTMTVRCAYKMLEEEHYIMIQKNKRAVISHNTVPGAGLPPLALASPEALCDLSESLALLFPSIFYCGFILCDEKDRINLHKILDEPDHTWDEPIIRFLFYITDKLNNPLLNNLFCDVMLYSYPSFLFCISKDPGGWKSAYSVLYKNLHQLISVQKSGNRTKLWNLIVQFYLDYKNNPCSAADNSAVDGYRWDKMQVCNSIASKLIHQIFLHIYPDDTFLPTPTALSREFSASTITVRRAITLMNNLGVTESVNGKGTRVLPEKERITKVNWKNPAVRKNILLYLQALQILALTCRATAKNMLSQLDANMLTATKGDILLTQRAGTPYPAVAACLKLLTQSNTRAAACEIYSSLVNILVWGHPLSYLPPYPKIATNADRLIASLDSHDADCFSLELEQILYALFFISREKALSVGIKDAALLDLPDIRC